MGQWGQMRLMDRNVATATENMCRRQIWPRNQCRLAFYERKLHSQPACFGLTPRDSPVLPQGSPGGIHCRVWSAWQPDGPDQRAPRGI